MEYEKWMWQAKLFEGGQREQSCDADFTNVPFQQLILANTTNSKLLGADAVSLLNKKISSGSS